MFVRSPRLRPLLAFAIAIAVPGLAGCATVQPWERGKLAHPTMAAAADDGAGADHLHAITEGAVGGRAGAGSGCGCN